MERPFLDRFQPQLILGFGGLLLLLGFAGYYSVRVLNRVDAIDNESTRAFVSRDDTLEEIRQQAYVFNSRLRGYLLDPDSDSIASHRAGAEAAWVHLRKALVAYRAVSAPESKELLDRLEADMARSWRTALTAFQWNAEMRRRLGYQTATEKIAPLRDQFRAAIDELRVIDQRQLRQTIANSAVLIDNLQRQLSIAVGVTLFLGATLAGVSLFHLIRLGSMARARYDALADAHERLERLSQNILQVQEDERRHIARELHDEVGQGLSALLVDLGNASAEGANGSAASTSHLASARRLAEETLASIRNVCLELRPSMLDDLGLIPALNWQARETERRTGIRIELLAEDSDLELPERHRTSVYRVVQEALANVARHSQATRAQIMVRREDHRLLIVVQDDGIGFDTHTTRGLGLLGMQERVAHFQGSLRVESAAGRGTILQIDLPVRSTPEPDAESMT